MGGSPMGLGPVSGLQQTGWSCGPRSMAKGRGLGLGARLERRSTRSGGLTMRSTRAQMPGIARCRGSRQRRRLAAGPAGARSGWSPTRCSSGGADLAREEVADGGAST